MLRKLARVIFNVLAALCVGVRLCPTVGRTGAAAAAAAAPGRG